MCEFSSNIRNDELTNEKCCLFNNCILQNNDRNGIQLLVPDDKSHELPKQLSLRSCEDNAISIRGTDNWQNKQKSIENKKGIWVLIGEYENSNAGHVLGDEVFAVWQSLCVFDLQDCEINIITNNQSRHQQQYKCLTNNRIHSFEDFKNKQTSFEILIAGMCRNGYALGHQLIKQQRCGISCRATYLCPFKETFERFRQHTYNTFGINESSDEFKGQKRSILLLDKDINASIHKCKIFEIDKMMEVIQNQHTTHNVKKINWNGMRIEDQVAEMSLVDVVITLPGSDMMNCIFLHPKSLIICPHGFYNGRKSGSNEIGGWFQYTHNSIQITDVTYVNTDNISYSDIVDKNALFEHIDKALYKIYDANVEKIN
jgi:hypothetical protein